MQPAAKKKADAVLDQEVMQICNSNTTTSNDQLVSQTAGLALCLRPPTKADAARVWKESRATLGSEGGANARCPGGYAGHKPGGGLTALCDITKGAFMRKAIIITIIIIIVYFELKFLVQSQK